MLIGICGRLGSGKSTLAEYLVREHGFEEYSFAKPIKDIAEIFGFTHSELYGTQLEKSEINQELGISGREFLQLFGTEIGRELLPRTIPNLKIEESIWIDIFTRRYRKACSDTTSTRPKIVVSDVRFQNEASAIRKLGGILVRVKRTTANESTHSSESGISAIQCDYEIDNDALSKEEAFRVVSQVLLR